MEISQIVNNTIVSLAFAVENNRYNDQLSNKRYKPQTQSNSRNKCIKTKMVHSNRFPAVRDQDQTIIARTAKFLDIALTGFFKLNPWFST